MTTFSRQAREAIQSAYDNPRWDALAERIEEVIELLDAGPPYPARVRRDRMQSPKLWHVRVHGSGESFSLLWEEADDGCARVLWAGASF